MLKLKINKFLPYILLAIFNLIVCFIYLNKGYEYTEMFRFVIQTYAFYILLASISKKLLNASIIFTFLVCSIIYTTELIYGTIDFNFFCSVYYTDLAESVSYLKTIPLKAIFAVIILLIISICLIKTKHTTLKLSTTWKVLLVIFLVSFPLVKIIKPHKYDPLVKDYLTDYFYVLPLKKVSLAYLYFEVKKQDEDINTRSDKLHTWKIQKRTENKKTIVVVIGESVRKEFLHAYGFPIKNTPFIDSSNNIQFNNYISVASHTPTSLLRTLTLSKDIVNYEINNSVVNLANEIDYNTYWISNQGKIGKWDVPASKIAKNSDTCIFMKEGSVYMNNLPDGDMLPHFKNILDKDKGTSKLIIMHMIGSHPYTCDRTNGKYDHFVKSKDVSCYIKSIKNLDFFLSETYNYLKQNKEPFDLVYFSDHGLIAKNNTKMAHSTNTKGVFNVPLIIWNDTLESKKYINSNRNGKDFLHLFSQLAGIKTQNIPYKYKYISEEKNEDGGNFVLHKRKKHNYDILEENSIEEIIKAIEN